MAIEAWKRVSLTKKTSAKGLKNHNFKSSHTATSKENDVSTTAQIMNLGEIQSKDAKKRSI
jgi:hypothetical protein